MTDGAHAYVVMLKTLAGVPPGLSASQRAQLESLLRIAVGKFAFPADFDHDGDGEDEALFLEFRKEVSPPTSQCRC